MYVPIHHFSCPTSPQYMYSIILSDSDNLSLPLLGVSVIHQLLLCSFSWVQTLHICLLSILFSKSMLVCVQTLIEAEDRKDLKVTRGFIEIQRRIDNFTRVGGLMTSFNRFFQWLIFSQLAGVVVYVCLAAYIPLKYGGEINIFTTMLLSLTSSFSVCAIMCTIYPLMGQVWEKSSRFKRTMKMLVWTQLQRQDYWEMGQRQDLNRIMLQISTCEPIGFKGGIFFTFKASTLLTVFYSILTHIIILLQLAL